MPRPRLTEEEISAMRQTILKAAFDILQEQGPEGLSIRAIADRVGVSHMVLYSYFENRDALTAALRDHARTHHQARQQEALARAHEGTARAVMRETLEGYVRFAQERPHAFHFIWSGQRWGRHHHGMSPKKRRHAHPRHHPGGLRQELNFLEQLIELGIEQGEFAERDPPIAALMTTSRVIGPLLFGEMSGSSTEETRQKLELEALEATMHYLTGKE